MRTPILFLLTIAALPSLAQNNIDTSAINAVFKRYQQDRPGCQITISRNDSIVFSKAWGTADLEHNVPLTTNSVIEAGSVSKQFTAAAILLLQQQGKLKLSDDIRKYIPELPAYSHVITIRHLIHHTSGLKDWGSIASVTGWPRGSKAYSNEDALEIIARQRTLNNVPGGEYLYSNSNYNLQAIIVQRVSGKSLADFTRQFIFIPAGMNNTQWRDNYKRIVPNRAIAYQKNNGIYEEDMPNENVYGNGGLLTTTDDLVKWNRFYLSGKLGGDELLQQQIAVDTFNNKLINYYAAGLNIQTTKGNKVIRHDGATASYRCMLEYFPDLKLSIAFLTNTSEFDGAKENMINEVEKLLLPPQAPATVVEAKKPVVPASSFISYAGKYKNDRSAYDATLSIKDSSLQMDGATLNPLDATHFSINSSKIVFDKNDHFFYITSDKDSIGFTKAAAANIISSDIKLYKGKYHSDETMSDIEVQENNGAFSIRLNSYTSYPLRPVYKDAFRIVDFGGMLVFEKGKNGGPEKFFITLSRARRIEFVKTKD